MASSKYNYDLGSTVYHVLAVEKRAGMVTGVMIRPGALTYLVTWPDLGETQHYGIELRSEYVPDYAQGDEESD
jgi:hypothetical protein